jgi:hypothetical protein
MRPEFIFLSMVIPDHNILGLNIDICLLPLIDEFSYEDSFEMDYQ